MENIADAVQVLDATHLIGVSLLIAVLVISVLYFSYRVIKEISKRNK
jgi:hypothetical protein